MRFIARNVLYIEAVLAVLVGVYAALRWSELPVVNRMVCLFFVALVLHIWEESRYPGGFSEMITEKIGFTASDFHFGELVTASYAMTVAFVPIFFPTVTWLAMTAMMLGLLEFIMHTAMIKLFRLKRPYSPGLTTAVVLMLPISVYTIHYTLRQGLMRPWYWPLSFAYLVAGLMLAQRIVVRASGKTYSDFLKNVRTGMFGSKTN